MEKLNLKKFEKATIEKEALNKVKGGKVAITYNKYFTQEWCTDDCDCD
jgi:natural product precursor